MDKQRIHQLKTALNAERTATSWTLLLLGANLFLRSKNFELKVTSITVDNRVVRFTPISLKNSFTIEFNAISTA
jgi:hypothetical protein